MEKDLSQLYQKIILNHNQNPYHFEKKPEAIIQLEAYNPLCGDQFQLYLFQENDIISEIYFHGYGCAISKASTSVLAEQLEGKKITEAKEIIQNFLAVVEGKEIQLSESYQDFQAFSVAKNFPGREECANLSWLSLQEFLES